MKTMNIKKVLSVLLVMLALPELSRWMGLRAG